MTRKQRLIQFTKKYGYLMLVGFGVALLLLAIILASTTKPNEQQPNPVVDVNAGRVEFGLPVLDASIVKNYNNRKLQMNSTLKQYEVHLGVDFVAVSGSDVMAVLDGKVIDVYSDYLEGTVVVLEHANNYKSVYGSLNESVNVTIGDVVSKGDVLGKISTSASSELETGAHLHFELLENDKKIDPAGYLNLEVK